MEALIDRILGRGPSNDWYASDRPICCIVVRMYASGALYGYRFARHFGHDQLYVDNPNPHLEHIDSPIDDAGLIGTSLPAAQWLIFVCLCGFPTF